MTEEYVPPAPIEEPIFVAPEAAPEAVAEQVPEAVQAPPAVDAAPSGTEPEPPVLTEAVPEAVVYELGQGPVEAIPVFHVPGNPIPDL